MEVVYAYALEMPKFVYVQLLNIEKPAKMKGDKVEVPASGQNTKYVVRLGSEVVGEFTTGNVLGWWIQDENTIV